MRRSKSIFKQYSASNLPKNLIFVALNTRLNRGDSVNYLCDMHFIYETANVEDATRNRLLRRALQKIPELSWFELYHELSSYHEP